MRKTPRQYRRRTVEVSAWAIGQEPPLSVLETRQLLGIKTRDSINAHLKALGYFGQKFLVWKQIKHVLGMNLWLYCNFGNHSRFQYAALREQGLAEAALQLHGIDLDKQLEELKNAYQRSKPDVFQAS